MSGGRSQAIQTQARIIADYLDRPGARLTTHAGGTPSRLWATEGPRGPELVKIQLGDGATDGHEHRRLGWKAMQIRHLERTCPAVATNYVPIDAVVGTSEWTAARMARLNARSAGEMLLSGASGGVTSRLRQFLTTLIDDGYLTAPTRSDCGSFHTAHVSRLKRRARHFRRSLMPELLLRDHFHLNDVRVRGFGPAMRELCRPAVISAAEPPFLSPTVHGDLNLNNILVDAGGRLHLIDPRGTSVASDFVYDLGKLCFSALVFDAASRGRASLHRIANQARAPGIEVKCAGPGVRDFAQEVLVGGVDRRLREADPQWAWRLGLCISFHALAEAAIRMAIGSVSERKVGTIYLVIGLYVTHQMGKVDCRRAGLAEIINHLAVPSLVP